MMIRNRRKRYIALCVVLMLALAGCTANQKDPGTADSAGTGVSTGTGAQADASAEGSDGQTATVLFMDDEAYVSRLDTAAYVTPGEYKGIAVSVEKAEVSEETLQYTINMYESQITKPKEVTGRALKEGDTAALDYSGRIKETDEVFEGGTAEGQSLEIGSGSFIDGFEDGMIGMEIGETRELELKFPDPYPNNPDLAGVPVIFTVTLNGISEPGELTDGDIAALGLPDVGTIGEFRDYIRLGLEEDAEAQTKANVQKAVVEKVMEQAAYTGTLPERLIERYVYMLDSSAGTQASGYGIPKEDLISETMAMEGFTGTADAFIREKAEAQVKELVLMEAIAREEEIFPAEEELTNGIARVLQQTGFETVEAYETAYGMRLNELLRADLTVVAVRAFLEEQAKVTYE